jgi:Phospholipase_D-nuclease N-terminal
MYLLATVALIAWILVWLVVAYRIIERRDIGGGTKTLWIVLILLFPLVGLLVYYLTLGRRTDEGFR